MIVKVGASDTAANAFDVCRNTILNFIQNRAGTSLPVEAWHGESFELEEIGAQRTAAVALNLPDSPRYWAARLDDADKAVAQRSWTVEVGVGEIDSQKVLVGCRLLCVTRGTPIPYNRTIPKFIRNLIETQKVELDDRPITIEPWLIAEEADVDEFTDLLLDPRRQCDVIAFALPENSVDDRETVANARLVARRTTGAAHVAIITGPASYYLSDRVGKEFSVFRQAIRTYKPLFNPELDEPFKHPLALPHRVVNWPGRGARDYEGLLVSQALIRTISRKDLEGVLPSFSTVRRMEAEYRIADIKSTGSSDSDLLKIAEEEISALRRSLDEEKATNAGLLQSADEELERAQSDAAQAHSTNIHLRQRVRELEGKLNNFSADFEVPIPTVTQEFEEWCNRYLSGSVEILNRAFQGVKKSEFEDVSLIYRALLLLKDYYVPMKRTGGQELVHRYQEACRSLGVTEEPTFSGERAGEEGDTYFVHFGGRRIELDRHLKKGNSREPRYCFRVYFFWDEETEQAVVGWLPSHLGTRAS